MPRTKRELYNSLRSAGLSQATFARLYKPVNTSEGVSVTPPLFATADEISRVAKPLDASAGYDQSASDTYALKQKENVQRQDASNISHDGGWGSGGGVLPSMKAKGWDWNHRVPIGLQGARSHADEYDPRGFSLETNHPVIINAQHRMAAALHLNKNQFIPMVHSEGEGFIFGDTRVNKSK